MKAKIIIDKNKIISKIDKRLFGSFIEHLGRAVYTGIYEPTHESTSPDGFRKDVSKIIKDINVPIIRYPGGNFVSGYNWEDGIGLKENRPHKMELAWQSIETNEVGIDDFIPWANSLNAEVMMAINLGTRGADEARNLLEYCNSTTDTYYANLRRKNGHENPYNIKVWCLGNEMDGQWQICHKTATEYARLAHETAKLMRVIDPSIELVACGSTSMDMETFGIWEETILRECYDDINYLSIHSYFDNYNGDSKDYLACSNKMDSFIKKVGAICASVQKEMKKDKKIYLSFDEWNVWKHDDSANEVKKWQIAPSLLENIYNLEDALVVGSLAITLINNSDLVKIGCLAQLVNVIAPIMTIKNGKVWKQTIFYPYMHALKYGKGIALDLKVECDTYNAQTYGKTSYILASATLNDNEVTLFVINRSLDESCTLDISLENAKIIEHLTLTASDLKIVNSPENENVFPVKCNTDNGIVLPSKSWNVIRYKIIEN